MTIDASTSKKSLKSTIPEIIDKQNYSLLMSIIHTKTNVGKLITNSLTQTIKNYRTQDVFKKLTYEHIW